ncbi:MAG: ABC transporter [Alkaliphilus sp.]|nr:ABC transporter ATP-binding protein [Alkaliphilus sp. AH-315-G20]PHS28927.1 MAG: ABC transporter [Alkaliphilus sp.]
MSVAIKVDKVKFKYSNKTVLNGLNLDIEKGSFLSILGPNGSGKTTLLKNMCNLLKPYDGAIYIDNLQLKGIKYKELAKKMAVVHQGSTPNFEFKIYDIVLMGRYPHQKRFSFDSKMDLDIVKQVMLDTDIWELREKSIFEISGGERQRVIIARALAQQPEILLLDEPITFLDIKHQISILNLCKKLNKEKKITIITTMHDINLASRYSDYILLLDSGRVEVLDVPEKVITEKNIESVYGIKVKLINGEKKVPYIIPE